MWPITLLVQKHEGIGNHVRETLAKSIKRTYSVQTESKGRSVNKHPDKLGGKAR